MQINLNKQQTGNNNEVTKVLKQETSKSQKMKDLFSLGLEIKEIAKLLDVRYNFVYNVLSNYCNLNNIELNTKPKENKKERIVELFEQGLTNKEIAFELKSNINYVYNIVKAYKKEKEATAN